MGGEHQYWFKKEKLREPLRYPLSRPRLDAALLQGGVKERIYSVRFLSGRGESPTLLEAELTPEGSAVHDFRSGRCMLTVWAIPGAALGAVEPLLATEGMSVLCAWLRESGDAGAVWRSEPHGLRLSVAEGAVVQQRY